jgi:hypothetical protein
MKKTTQQPSDRARLLAWLQTAIELELATIPPYLLALLSIKLPSNREPAELIRSVMIEEMLHLALVSNVLNAVSGHPRLDQQTIPSYPLKMTFEGKVFKDRNFWIDLAPFSEPVIKTFMKIEQPQDPPRIEGFFLALKKIDVPALTIGGFYAQIVLLLEQMEQKTPGKVFIGKPEFQIHKDYYWAGGGEIVAVNDLASAKMALDLVIQQGEGAWSSGPGQAAQGFGDNFDIGHYYRFSEIFYGHRYQKSDDPKGPPTGATIDVDYAQAYPFKKNPKRSDYPPGSALRKLNDDFNQRYSDMLRQLQEALNGSPKTLYTAVMDSMHHLSPVAHEMMKTPIIPGRKTTGCPTFEWRD